MPNDAIKTTAPVVHLIRRFKAPRERVFRAWTDPQRLALWWGPEGRTAPVVELDVRAGGRWRACMRSPEGDEAWVRGEYREVDPPNRLVFTWAWEDADAPSGGSEQETLVELDFVDMGDETEIRLTHLGFETAEQCELHNEGWTSSLECLTDHLAAN